jgi:predicted acylesterase/phospholipase RssA
MRSFLTQLFLLCLSWQVFAAASAVAQNVDPPDATSKSFACPGTKRAVVISGGGVKGAYQVGALWFLVNVLNCDFDRILGTSTGAITAATLAQATSHDELKLQVNVMRSEYETLTSASQIAENYHLALARLVLPKWLGGTDGTATLAPVEKRLRERFKSDHVPEKLAISVVSLQAGPLDPTWTRVENIFDLVIGSASLPIAIEPRRARVWTRARVMKLEGDTVTIDFYFVGAGLPDPSCRFKIDKTRTVRCQQIDGSLNVRSQATPLTSSAGGLPSGNGERWVVTTLKLKLFDLTAQDRTTLQRFADQIQYSPAGFGIPRPTSPISRGQLVWFFPPQSEFTSIHQLVDGGVTDNTPLSQAIQLIGDERGVDTIIALLAGRDTAILSKVEELHGAGMIGTTSFGHLWEAYQYQAFRANEQYLALYKNMCDASAELQHTRAWLLELEQKLGTEEFRRILESMKSKLPSSIANQLIPAGYGTLVSPAACAESHSDKWMLWTIDPGQSGIDGTLVVEPAKVKQAIQSGCKRAATLSYDAFAPRELPNTSSFDRDNRAKSYAEQACRPLLNQ